MMSTVIKLTSEKGKPMLGYEGFIYTLDRQTEAKMIFPGQNRDYKGRCHTNSIMDAIVFGPTEHCHAPNHDRIPGVELRNQIKSRSGDSEEPSSVILHSAIRSFPLDSAGQLPKTETLLRTIRRQREAEAPNPDNLFVMFALRSPWADKRDEKENIPNVYFEKRTTGLARENKQTKKEKEKKNVLTLKMSDMTSSSRC